MFRPNVYCEIQRRSGVNGYGKPAFSAPERVMCGIVRLERESLKTSVRADSSATRGSAKEAVATARILFLREVRLSEGDVVEVMGIKLTVQSVWPRHHVNGRFDHWQVDLEIFGGP